MDDTTSELILSWVKRIETWSVQKGALDNIKEAKNFD